MSTRINLSLPENLFDKIQLQADGNKVSVNTEIISILETVFYDEPVDYGALLQSIIDDIPTAIATGNEFALNKLPCFSKISTGSLDSSHVYIPSISRARLGTEFKNAVNKGLVPGVSIAKNIDGTDKVINKTLIYKYD
jgi:hypothetical protein